MTRVLVTGGTGFLGSRLVEHFLDEGARVRCAGHASQDPTSPEPAPEEGLEYVELDVRDASRLVEVAASMDLVVHTAAVTDASSPKERALQEEVNVGGTRNVVEACRAEGVPRMLHVSSTAAVGISADPEHPADEDFGFNLHGVGPGYAASKRRAEKLVLGADGPNLSTLVVNPGFMFGPHGRRYRGAEIIERVLERRVVPCTNGGLSVVHVDDVVRGIGKLLDRGRSGERYILSGPNVTFREIAETVCRVAGVRRTVLPVPDLIRDAFGFLKHSLFARGAFRPYLSGPYAYQFYSSERAERELGYDSRQFGEIVADYLSWAGVR